MSAGRLLLLGWWGLVLWQLVWHLLLPPPSGSGSVPLALLALVPLLALSRIAVGGGPRGRFWGMLMVMPYFMYAIMEAWSNPPQRMAAIFQVALCLAYFAAIGKLSRQVR